MSLLNYTHLRAFRAVAAEGNLTRAAEKLGVAQSAVSTQIKALEARLGHALFERRGRSMALTEAGRIAFDCADRAFAAGDELVETLAGRSGAGQVIRVGALATLSRNFQLNFLRPLVQDPDVSVILRSGSIGELLGELEALRLDVVLTNAPPRHDAATPWREHRIDDQPVSLVGHPARRCPGRRDLAELVAAQPLVLPAEGQRAARRFRPAHGARGPVARGSRRKPTTWRCCVFWSGRTRGWRWCRPSSCRTSWRPVYWWRRCACRTCTRPSGPSPCPAGFPNPALARVLSAE
jgi:LysR family transcriptional activator of nhaA